MASFDSLLGRVFHPISHLHLDATSITTTDIGRYRFTRTTPATMRHLLRWTIPDAALTSIQGEVRCGANPSIPVLARYSGMLYAQATRSMQPRDVHFLGRFKTPTEVFRSQTHSALPRIPALTRSTDRTTVLRRHAYRSARSGTASAQAP